MIEQHGQLEASGRQTAEVHIRVPASLHNRDFQQTPKKLSLLERSET